MSAREEGVRRIEVEGGGCVDSVEQREGGRGRRVCGGRYRGRSVCGGR